MSQRGIRRLRSDAGAITLEYLALTGAVMLLVGCLAVGGGQRSVSNAFATLFCKVQQVIAGGGGSCAQASTNNADYKPSTCQVSMDSLNVKVQVKALVVRLGHDAKMTTTYFSDGTVTVAISNDVKAGVEVGIGGKGKLAVGKNGSFKPGADANAGAVLRGQGVMTWNFKNAAEADHFSGSLQRRFATHVTGNPLILGASWVYEKVAGKPQLPDPTSVTAAGGGEAYGEAKVDVPILANGTLKAQGGILLSRTVGKDKGKTYVETAVAVDLTGTASASIFGAQIGGEEKGIGVMKIRYDENGNPTRVTFQSSQTGKFKTTLGQPNKLKDFLDLKKVIKGSAGGGDQESVLVTTTLDLDTPEKLAAFQRWHDGLSMGHAASTAWDAVWGGLWGDEPGADANIPDGEFGNLLRSQAKTSVVVYDGTNLAYGGGIEASAGLKAGLEIEVGDESSKAISAKYLGAPDAQGNREVVDLPDCVAK